MLVFVEYYMQLETDSRSVKQLMWVLLFWFFLLCIFKCELLETAVMAYVVNNYIMGLVLLWQTKS